MYIYIIFVSENLGKIWKNPQIFMIYFKLIAAYCHLEVHPPFLHVPISNALC
jgi:hypothetical protein